MSTAKRGIATEEAKQVAKDDWSFVTDIAAGYDHIC
jgi:thiamine biosynthesis protein ThiC